MHDVTNWLKTVTIHIAQYLTKARQLDNETLSINRTYNRNIFLQKYAENNVRRLVPDLFLIFMKTFI